MKTTEQKETLQPTMVNYVTDINAGIQSTRLTRHAISYIVNGQCYIYDADRSLHAQKGDVIFLDQGYHHIEQIPEKGSTFEQITVYIDSEVLHRIVSGFTSNFNMTISSSHICPNCSRVSSLVTKSKERLESLFNNVHSSMKSGSFAHDHPGEMIKLAELLYTILSDDDNCLKSKLIGSIDSSKSAFEQIIQNHILKDASVEELASMCNRSMTSFKKEFKRIYELPPHQWFLRQRLNHARLLLISTKKSIAEIGMESTFPNTSHFIKLFRKFYNTTPAQYRNEYEAAQGEQHTQIESLAAIK